MEPRSFFIAGVQHHRIKDVLGELAESMELTLVPEPTNQFDPNAVQIEYNGTMLGFVPRKFSSEVSAALEVDASLTCAIISLNRSAKPWEMCEVEIIEESALGFDDDEGDLD